MKSFAPFVCAVIAIFLIMLGLASVDATHKPTAPTKEQTQHIIDSVWLANHKEKLRTMECERAAFERLCDSLQSIKR